jgi:hypothetical protein
MNPVYFWLKRKVMRVRCLFGKHSIKLSAHGYRTPGCIWCKMYTNGYGEGKKND